MKNISLLLLKSFSKSEILLFSRFVESKYFNTDKYVLKLWNLLKKHLTLKKSFEESWQTKIYWEVFGEKKNKKKVLNKKERSLFNAKMSLLLALAKQFIVIESLNKKQALKSEILYEELLERQQLEIYHRQVKKDRKILAQQQLKDSKYYQFVYTLENNYLIFLHQKRLLLKEDNISEINYHLDMYYMIQKLKLQGTALSLSKLSDKKIFDYSSMEAIDYLVSLPQYSSQALIQLHSTIIDLMQSDEGSTYFHLLDLLNSYQSSISVENLNDFYTVASNFCIKKIQKGELQYNHYLYELYKIMDEKSLLTQDGLIDINRLKNIVGLSCRIKDFDWSKELVNKYQSVFRHKNKKSVSHFNLGTIAFYESKYKEALSHFIRVKKINIAYDINCRMMLLKLHYELDRAYDDRTITKMHATRRYLHNHKKLNTVHKKNFKNFINELIKIYNTRFKIGKLTKERIANDIDNLKFISDKKWLLEKLKEIN